MKVIDAVGLRAYMQEMRGRGKVSWTQGSKFHTFEGRFLTNWRIGVDFEDAPVPLPEIDTLDGRQRIEPSFGGYKRTYEVDGFVLVGMFPYRHVSDNVWECSVDVLAQKQ